MNDLDEKIDYYESQVSILENKLGNIESDTLEHWDDYKDSISSDSYDSYLSHSISVLENRLDEAREVLESLLDKRDSQIDDDVFF